MASEIKIGVEEIYNLCCPECQKKLAATVASKMATDSIAAELIKQWEKPKEVKSED